MHYSISYVCEHDKAEQLRTQIPAVHGYLDELRMYRLTSVWVRNLAGETDMELNANMDIHLSKTNQRQTYNDIAINYRCVIVQLQHDPEFLVQLRSQQRSHIHPI